MNKRFINDKILKYTSLGGVLLFLFVPILQELTHFKSWEKPLVGDFTPAPDTSFTWQSWFSGRYQEKKDKYFEDNFGLHNYYVRLNSQLDYSLFKKANAKNVVIGKDNFLIETPYIDAYYGRDFIGQKNINGLAETLLKLQDTLTRRGQLIFVVFAPGKASYYPEYMPDNLKSKPGITNYMYFTNCFKQKGINHIDFNKWFVSQKKTTPYPLYPQYGIHWSYYGSMLALDSIIKYIECKTGKNLPEMELAGMEVSDSLRGGDNDILKAMNLYYEPKSCKMAYPSYQVKYNPPTEKKLKLLVIGDSFWWQIYGSHLTDSLFESSRFWYYNKEMYPESYVEQLYVFNADNQSIIKNSDVIILIHSESTLSKFGNGFVDMCYDAYFEPKKRQERIKEVKLKILESVEWYNSIKEKSRLTGLSVDSLLTLNAIYAIELKIE